MVLQRRKRYLTTIIAILILSLFIFACSPLSETTLLMRLTLKKVKIEKPANSWIDYRNNWNGEVLIKPDLQNLLLVLTNKYREVMRAKGPHPLAQEYPKFLERRNSVEKNCEKIIGEFTNTLRLNQILVNFNDDYEVVNFWVAEASSFNWATKFGNMIGIDETLEEELLYKYSIMRYFDQPLELARCMQTYTKFLIYRHPFEQIVSAFHNVFAISKTFTFARLHGDEIVKINYLMVTEGPKYDKLSLEQKQEITKQQERILLPKKDLNITFLEFVTYVASFLDSNRLHALNRHWMPITTSSNPCAVEYDILIDHDFVVEESQILVDYLQKNNQSNSPIYFDKYPKKATRDKCNEYFRDIPQNLREKLHKIFLNDFIVFGYSYNGDSQDYACEEKSHE